MLDPSNAAFGCMGLVIIFGLMVVVISTIYICHVAGCSQLWW